MADISISITKEGADALEKTKKDLLIAVKNNLSEKDKLQKVLDQNEKELGYMQAQVEEIIGVMNKGMDMSNDAVTTLSNKLGKLAAWIRTKI